MICDGELRLLRDPRANPILDRNGREEKWRSVVFDGGSSSNRGQQCSYCTGFEGGWACPDDSYYSVASWYRDHVGYGGVSDDGKKLFAGVFQMGRRKPVLKKALGEPDQDDMPDSECPAPAWQRRPRSDCDRVITPRQLPDWYRCVR